MKIDSSNIRLSSQHSIIQRQTVGESVKVRTGGQRSDSGKQELLPPAKGVPVVDMVTLSDMARLSQPVGKTEINIDGEGLSPTPEMRVLKLIVEKMLGIEIDPSPVEISPDDSDELL